MEIVQQWDGQSSELKAQLVSAVQFAEHLSSELDRTRIERDRLRDLLSGSGSKGQAFTPEVA